MSSSSALTPRTPTSPSKMQADAIMREAEARHANFRRNSMAQAVEAEEHRQDHDLQMRAMNNIARRDSIGYNGMYGHVMGMGASPYSMMGADPITMAAVGGMYPGYGGMNPMLGGINPMIGAYSPLALQSTYMNNPLLAAQMANISAMGGLGMPAMGLGMNPMMMAGGLGGLGMSPLLAARASPLAYGGLANPMLNPLAADVVTSRLVGGVF